MGELDILGKSTTTQLKTGVPSYEVDSKIVDEVGAGKETAWINTYWSKYLGYYKTIPEFKQAVDALAMWTAGKGWTADNRTRAALDVVNGWGEDSFDSIMQNLIKVKKINGDAYAEIIRNDKGTLVNLKPLDPASVRVVCNEQGRIIRYEQRSKYAGGKFHTFKPEEIFHIANDRVADEIHGVSVIEACEWVILARNEAMADKRRQLHRSTIRIMEIDEDDTARLTNLKKDFAEAINKGELLLVPKGTGAIQDLVPPTTEHIEWIRYLENFFYQALGVPKVILGGTAENTEASAKVSVIVYEPTFTKEITELELDIWNQLGIKIKINKQPSLMDNMQSLEQKGGQAQVGFQPNDVTAGVGK